MAGAIGALLNYIVNNRLLTMERKQEDLMATAVAEGTGIIAENRTSTLEYEQALAQDNLPVFADALGLAAAARQQSNQAELALHDSNQLHNTMADVLVRYLVRTELATVRSEEDEAAPLKLPPLNQMVGDVPSEPTRPYTYYFTIHWGMLSAMAVTAGTSLDAVLDEAQHNV